MARRRASTPHQRNLFFGLNFRGPKHISGIPSITGDVLEAYECKNVKLDPDTGFRCIMGRRYKNATALTENGHTLRHFTDYSTAEHLLIGAGDKIYIDSGLAGTPVLSKTLTTFDITAFTESFGKHFFYVNGQDVPQKFNGTSWYRLGVLAPSSAPAVADGGAGVLAGTYRYFYTYVHSDVALGYEAESRRSAFSAEITVTGGRKITLTLAAATDSQVSLTRIYRVSSISAEWKLIVEQSSALTTYTDNATEDSLDAATVPQYVEEGAPIDSDGNPMLLERIGQWKNRLWGSVGSMLYNTRPDRPEKWFSDFSVDAQPNDVDQEGGLSVVSFIAFKNMLVVFTRNKMVLVGGDEEPWNFIDYSNNIGCIAARSVAICEGNLFWLSASGVYRWDGESAPKNISGQIENDFERNSRGLMDSPTTSLAKAAGRYNSKDRSYWLSVPFSSNPFNSRTFTYDLAFAEKREGSPWAWHDYGFVDAVETPGRDFYTLKTNTGYYLLHNIGNTIEDGTTKPAATYETKHWDFGAPDLDKITMKFSAGVYITGDVVTFTAFYDNGARSDSFTLSTSGSNWNVGTWNVAQWGGTTVAFRTLDGKQDDVGRIIGFKVEMSGDAIFHSFTMNYVLQEGYTE